MIFLPLEDSLPKQRKQKTLNVRNALLLINILSDLQMFVEEEEEEAECLLSHMSVSVHL